ncbi:class I SAM-dependent methyltransferase [Plantactinospora sp. GCM10030261]|uniref:class I SAM-dependent methyltransferase n=1 Tax=Plantactinospora sp. GCM10030261 TaxID=3273420 RepID=UPI00361B7923
MSITANTEQARRWNGDTGRRWVAQRERHAAVRRGLIPHLLRTAAIAPSDRVLDVGCGCGDTTIAAARLAGPGGSATGLDLSGPMLAVARQQAADAAVANVRFVQGDAQTHPLAPGAYDVVLSSFGVMFFDDPAAAFGGFCSALRPGGRLAFLCWQDESRNEVFSIPLVAVRAHAQQPVPAAADLFADPRRVTDLLTGAGFADVRVESLRAPARFGSDVPDVLDHVRSTSAFQTRLADLDDEALGERVLATMTEAYTARLRPDGVWVEAAAWLIAATRS